MIWEKLENPGKFKRWSLNIISGIVRHMGEIFFPIASWVFYVYVKDSISMELSLISLFSGAGLTICLLWSWKCSIFEEDKRAFLFKRVGRRASDLLINMKNSSKESIRDRDIEEVDKIYSDLERLGRRYFLHDPEKSECSNDDFQGY